MAENRITEENRNMENIITPPEGLRIRLRSKSESDVSKLKADVLVYHHNIVRVKRYVDMINKCPLVSSPQVMRKQRRKEGVCERDEQDRRLVRKCIKYYAQMVQQNHEEGQGSTGHTGEVNL